MGKGREIFAVESVVGDRLKRNAIEGWRAKEFSGPNHRNDRQQMSGRSGGSGI